VPIPWKFADLQQPPEESKQGFYPLSQFAVRQKALSKAPKGLVSPGYMLVSRNHYHLGWSQKTYRRLKNVVAVMEYLPDPKWSAEQALLRDAPGGDDEGSGLSVDQEDRLRKAFVMFDTDGSGKLSPKELRQVLKAVDIDVDAEEKSGTDLASLVRDDDGDGEVDFEELKTMMTKHSFYKMQPGRYYVALSLVEAESLRGTMHALRGDSGGR
jgi:hypothetical protein